MDILPYTVKYKAGTDKTVQPGIHGRFKTLEDAQAALVACVKFFGGGKETESGVVVGRAVCGIITDADLAKKASEEPQQDDEFGAVTVPELEVTENDALRAEVNRLRAQLEKQECAESSDYEPEEIKKPAKSKKSLSTSSTGAA